VFDCALGAAARAIPDPRWRGEVVDVARRAGADQGVVGRAREVVATAAFGLRLRSLRATGGRAGQAWRQGARLGAGLLLVSAWVGSMAAVGDDPAEVEVASVVAALALAAALAAWVQGHRLARVAATAAALAASWAAVGWDAVSTAVAVALAAMVVADGGRVWRRLGTVATGGGQDGDVPDAGPGGGLRRPWRRPGSAATAQTGGGQERGISQGPFGGSLRRPWRRPGSAATAQTDRGQRGVAGSGGGVQPGGRWWRWGGAVGLGLLGLAALTGREMASRA
jgi:hypothetical protein